VKVTITSKFQLTINDYGRQEGGEYDGHFWVKMTLKNVGPDTENIDSDYTKVESMTGGIYNWEGDNETMGSPPNSLTSGSTATWISYYDMPQSSQPKTLMYSTHTFRNFK
jgi:hypothetical protein